MNPTRTILRLAAVIGMLVFIVLVSISLHGFSIGAFDDIALERTEHYSFPHVGKAQPRRSDEFMVSLPLVAAQCRTKSFCPAFNDECFVAPTDMFVMTPPCPVFDWTVPGQFPNWGYFLFGFERGMAWNWWSRYLLLPLLAFAFFLICTKSVPLSAVAAFSITLGAPTQWWTTTVPYHLVFLLGSLLSVWGVINSRGRAGIAFSAACLFVSAASFSFSFYPPFQFPLILLFASLLPILLRRGVKTPRSHESARRLAFLAAMLLLVAEFCYFAVSHGATLEAISRSIYPGRRHATGGPLEDGIVLSLFKFIALFDTFHAPGGTNPCECAMFFTPFIPMAAGAVWLVCRNGVSRSWRAAPLVVLCALLAMWTFLKLPGWVGRITFFKIIPTPRAAAILSLVAMFAMFLEFGALRAKECQMPWLWAAIVALASSAICLGMCWSLDPLRGYFDSSPPLLVAGVILYGATALGLLRGSLPIFLPACAVAAILQGWFVNPLCVGAAPLTEKKLVETAAAIEAEHGHGIWVSSNEYLSQLLVANGFKCLGGVMSQPRPEIWSRIDPLLNQAPVWNRYAHVQANVTNTEKSQARLLNEAKFIWNLSADDAAALGVRYLIDPPDYAMPKGAAKICNADGHGIWCLDSTMGKVALPRAVLDAPYSVRDDGAAGVVECAFPCGVELLEANVISDAPTCAVIRATFRFKAPGSVKNIPVSASLGVANESGKVLFECHGLSLCGLQGLGDALSGKVVDVDIPGIIPPDFAFLNNRRFALVFHDALSGERLDGRDTRGRRMKRVHVPVGNKSSPETHH